jgi:hypothetical protein
MDILDKITKPFRKPEGYVSAKEEAAAAAAAKKAAPAPAAAPQIGGVNMGAMQRREKAAGLKDGGPVAGPGTGTSDSIPAKLSDGEYVIPADSVQAIGVDVLDAMVAATHKPTDQPAATARGVPMLANGGMMRGKKCYADGGLVTDEEKKKGYGVRMAWEQPSTPVTTAAALAPPAPPVPPPAPMSPELLAQLSDPRIAPRDAPGAMGGAATLPPMTAPSTAAGVPDPANRARDSMAASPPVVPPVAFNPRMDSNAAGGGAAVPVPNGYTGPQGVGVPGAGDARKVVDAQGRVLYTNQGIESDAGLMGRGGVPSAANIGAIDAIAGRQQREALGTAMAQQQAEANSPRALALEQIKSIRDRNQPLTARGIQTLTDLNTADNTARDSAQRNANEARRVASGEAEAAQRIGVGRDLQATTKELAALQAKFAASTDPKERERLREEILLRQGKDKNEPNRFTVVPGGSAVDPATGQVVREPSRVLDNQTGRFVEQGAAAAAPKYETGKVYQDAQGRKAKWDGSKFVPA